MKKLIKMIGLIIGGIIIVILVTGLFFINLSPEFGGKHTQKDIMRYEKSGHYTDGKFQNLIPTTMDMSFRNIVAMTKEFIKGNPNGIPDFELPMQSIDSINLEEKKDTNRLVWFGHSAFLLQLDGKNILLDPMLGDTPAPHPMLGTKRYSKKLPIEITKLPVIDMMIISHDHYDHLDYGSIQLLKDKTKEFYVPLGVGAHLISWGVPEENVHELNWWDEIVQNDVHLAFTPSRHFSGRGLADNSSTMWGSWVIKGKKHNIYFSGDSGYGPHFKEIGEKYGPFDFAMMECGQYNEKWANIHMMPEETAQASLDVKANVMMPIHWGAFKLALHDWDDPVKRVISKAKDLAVNITVPKIGEEIRLDKLDLNSSDWWNN